MEIEKIIDMDLKNTQQNEFLNSSLWNNINNGIDFGIRYLCPDLLENEIIYVKDNLINYGLKEGVKKTIEEAIETGKQAMGILSGNFENIGQIQSVVKNGGIIDKISDLLEVAINKAESNGKIDRGISTVLKKGKTSILSSIENNIESTLNKQISNAERLEKYINNWKGYYENRNFEGMQKEYLKIKNSLKELIPIENTLKNARYIENIHNLIKNNGGKFDLTQDEIDLFQKLSVVK